MKQSVSMVFLKVVFITVITLMLLYGVFLAIKAFNSGVGSMMLF